MRTQDVDRGALLTRCGLRLNKPVQSYLQLESCSTAVLAVDAASSIARRAIESSVRSLDQPACSHRAIAAVERMQRRDDSAGVGFENRSAAEDAVIVAALGGNAVELAVCSLQQANRVVPVSKGEVVQGGETAVGR